MSQLAAGTAGSNGFCKIFMLHAKKLVIDLTQTWRIPNPLDPIFRISATVWIWAAPGTESAQTQKVYTKT